MGAGNVWGRFNNPAGTVVMDADDAKSAINLTLKVADIDTANKQRDEHLKTADFFSAEQFPTITFVSKTIKKVDDKTWTVTGDLTIKGTTKSITVKLEKVGEATAQGQTRLGLETTFTIKRADYGVDALPQGVGIDDPPSPSPSKASNSKAAQQRNTGVPPVIDRLRCHGVCAQFADPG